MSPIADNRRRRRCWLVQLLALLVLSGCSAPPPASAAAPGAVVLQYHHIDTQTPAVTSTSPALFEQHLALIRTGGYTVWPMARLLAALRGEIEFEDNVVVITFDDAYLSIHQQALPLLRDAGLPFTVFVATRFIRADSADAKTANAGNPQFLSWQQLRELQAAGGTIANHTHTHPHLLRRMPGETQSQHLARVRNEITTAQNLLEDRLGVTDKLLAYPYGEYNRDIADLVRDMGYVAFGQQSGPVGKDSDMAVLARFPLSGRFAADLDSLQTKLATWPLPIETVFYEPVLDADAAMPPLALRFNRDDPAFDNVEFDNLQFENLVCYGPHGTTALTTLGPGQFSARSTQPLPVGRSRYNCTMPVANAGRFYWYSQLWIRPRADGSWYPEP